MNNAHRDFDITVRVRVKVENHELIQLWAVMLANSVEDFLDNDERHEVIDNAYLTPVADASATKELPGRDDAN